MDSLYEVRVRLLENTLPLVTVTTVTIEIRHLTPEIHQMFNISEMQQGRETCHTPNLAVDATVCILWVQLKCVHFMETKVYKKHTNWLGKGKCHATKIRPKTIGGGIFGRAFERR